MTDAHVNNPRKTEIVIRAFRQGILGHRFSRPLTPAEATRLAELIEKHGSCLFTDKETGLALGGWFCTAECCETALLIFCSDTGVTMTAQSAGDKSFIPAGADVVQIRVEQVGAADQARALQVASVASQVATQVAAEVSTKVTATLSKEIAQKTTAAVLENAGNYSQTEEAELKLSWHQEKPN